MGCCMVVTLCTINQHFTIMKKIVFIFSLFLITGIVAVNQANAQSVSIKDVWVDYTEYVDCLNDGMGENVIGTLPIHMVFHYNKDGFLTKFHYQSQGGELVGDQTGMVYHGGGVNQAMIKAPKPNCVGAYTFTYVIRLHYVGQGVQFFAKGIHHITVNANGDLTTEFDRWSVECK